MVKYFHVKYDTIEKYKSKKKFIFNGGKEIVLQVFLLYTKKLCESLISVIIQKVRSTKKRDFRGSKMFDSENSFTKDDVNAANNHFQSMYIMSTRTTQILMSATHGGRRRY